jgi:hypothetical protein
VKAKDAQPSSSFVPSSLSQDVMNDQSAAAGFMSEYIDVKESHRKRKTVSEYCFSAPVAKRPGPCPKSLTVSQMVRLGKLIKPDVSGKSHVVIIDVFKFDFSTLSWSVLPQTVEFTVENIALGEGGFRRAYKASSSTTGFEGKEWVVKRYLEDVVKEITTDLNQSMEEQTKKVIQMHYLSKNFADQLSQVVKQNNVGKDFGPVMQFRMAYFGKLQGAGECVTIEEYIHGEFVKYVNNTGEVCVPSDDVLGQKAVCLVHFSYEKSQHRLMVLDLQGSNNTLYDPEIASEKLVDEGNEYMFCAGNLSHHAIQTFVKNHNCNKFCHLLGLNSLAK